MKTLQLKQDFYWAGILDKNLRVFDIIMYTEFGTTYNSYILKAGDETILFETAKEKFFGDYKAALSEQLDIAQIDYYCRRPYRAGSCRFHRSYHCRKSHSENHRNPYGNQLSEKYRE